jgi:Carboxypeptidase regulatory-like domain
MFKQLSSKAVAVVLAVVVVLCTYLVHAQDNSGTLQGVVRNLSGAPVSGSFVKMKNPERRLSFMAITQAQGRYVVNKLPAGIYTVQAIGGDYQSELSAPLQVAAGQPATLDLSPTTMRTPQLPGAWPGRRPGERGGEAEATTGGAPTLPEGAGKEIVATKCAVGCHDAQRVVRARVDRDRWEEIIRNMRLYARGSTLSKDLTDQEAKVLLDYLATNFGARESRKAEAGSKQPLAQDARPG